MNYLFTKILGEFELERFIRRLSIGVVLTIVITIWMGVTEGFGHEGVGAAIVAALWLVEGITYGKGIMLAITPRGVDVDFMAKALWFGVSFAIGVMAGGILFVIDTLRAISYWHYKKKRRTGMHSTRCMLWRIRQEHLKTGNKYLYRDERSGGMNNE